MQLSPYSTYVDGRAELDDFVPLPPFPKMLCSRSAFAVSACQGTANLGTYTSLVRWDGYPFDTHADTAHELNPEEKSLFEHITGYNGARTMTNSELMQKFNMSQAQISYKKSLLHKKIEGIMNRPGIRKRFSK